VNFEYVRSVGRDFTMKNGDTVYIRKGGAKICSDAYKEWLIEATLGKEF
jgi:hypothetical protein